MDINKIKEDTLKDMQSDHIVSRCRCANCGFIYDYTIQVGGYASYAKQCIKCESTALDIISEHKKDSAFKQWST